MEPHPFIITMIQYITKCKYAQNKEKKEGLILTVGKKVHQAVVTLKITSGNFQTFAMETDDQEASKLYSDFSQQLSHMVSELSNRVRIIDQKPSMEPDGPEMHTW